MSNEVSARYLEVWLQDQHVGWLCEANGIVRFIASENYLTSRSRRTLSMSMSVPGAESLTHRILINRFDPAVYRERGELPPFFAGLLPEGPLRLRLAATRQCGRDMDDFGILAAAGEDLPGAVRIVPADFANLTPAALAYGVDGGANSYELSAPESAAAGAASLSGMQDKLALSKDEGGMHYGLPGRGKLSDTVAKLPSDNNDGLTMNEYVCMKLAALAGVAVARCDLAPMLSLSDHPNLVEELGAATRFLAVERFDRALGGAVHMEDACQLLTLMPSQKYADRKYFIMLLRILNRIGAHGIDDIRQLFIRKTVNTLLGNSDAHLKNFSVLYLDGINPSLAPAYDIVCVTARPEFQGFSKNVKIDQHQRSETLDTYASVAKDAGIAERICKASVRQTVSLAKEIWPAILNEMDVPPPVRDEILGRLKTLPLALGK